MKQKSKFIVSSALGFSLPLMMPVSVFAKDDCSEAKDIVNVAQTFYAPEAELVDKINVDLKLSLKAIGESPEPTGLLYRYANEEVTLNLDEDGRVLELEKALNFHKDGELCKLVNGKVPIDDGKDSTHANMQFKFFYSDTDGSHDIADIFEGAKDGSKIMKGLAPGGLGFVVPSLKTLVLKPQDKNGAAPKIRFVKDGVDIEAPNSAFIGTTRLYKLKDIKRSKADTILIDGPYILEAHFKISDEDIAKAQVKHETKADITE